jgi:DUF4097 and DUF4098 domain-containing protein YvlB
VRLRVENVSGSVEIETHDVARTEVRVVSLHPGAAWLVKRARISERRSAGGHEITVEIPKGLVKAGFWLRDDTGVAIQVRVPSGAELEISTASASIAAHGTYRSADIRSASGAIAVEKTVGPARVRTAGGHVELGSVDEANVHSASGDVSIAFAAAGGKVTTASGDVELGRTGSLIRVRTASGDVRLGEALQGASIETVSGDQRIERAAAGDYVLRAVSGDIAVAVVPGSLVRFDAASMSGHVESDIDVRASRDAVGGRGDVRELLVQAKTVSGDISVVRAAS